MLINNKDLLWSYAATFLKVAASVLLLPLVLRMMDSETVGIWTVFMAITSLVTLLDFGFNPSFTRNVTYVFSGVQVLKSQGFSTVKQGELIIDYGLLKGLISAMKWFYLRGAILLFLLLSTFGTFYIYTVLKNYHGNHLEVYLAWSILCVINTYNLFTFYYDSLLQGKGLIKKSKQIVVVSQFVYLIIAALFIFIGYGLVSIVAAQAFSVITVRYLSHRFFFTDEIKNHLKKSVASSSSEILRIMSTNAIKIGITTLGSILVQRSAIVIGSLYLALNDIASYGITMQIIGLISAVAAIYVATYQPKIVQLRVEDNLKSIKRLYVRGQLFLLATFVLGGVFVLFFGKLGVGLIGSQTVLMDKGMIALALIVSFLETNHAIAGNIILTKNEVPFFKASLISGLVTILLLLIFFNFLNLGIVSMIAAPGIAQAAYQNWKWPLVVKRELNLKFLNLLE